MIVAVRKVLGTGLLAASLAGSPWLGCATATKKAEQEKQVQRAGSHYDIAVDHVANGRLEMGLRELLQAERLDPKSARIQHGLAIAYLQKGKPEQAEAHFERVLELNHQHHEARYNLATLYLNQGRLDECIEHSRILFDDPTFTEPYRALTNWGWAAWRQGDAHQSRELLQRALEFNRFYWPTHMNLGILEAEQGHRPEAIRHFTQVLDLAPGPSATAEASYRLAEIYVSLGKRAEAVGHLRTAVVKAPSDPWGRKSEEYLRLLR